MKIAEEEHLRRHAVIHARTVPFHNEVLLLVKPMPKQFF
jgi:hypothetical protein